MASEATIVSGVAGRYALALYELANQQSALDTVSADLASLRRMIGASADLKNVLVTQVISRGIRAKAVAAVIERAALSSLVGNFIGVVARNGRLSAVPEIITAYDQLLADRRGEVTATITAAQALSQSQIDALKDNLKRTTGMNSVALDIWIDPTIIGGLIVKIGSRRVDGSLRTKLRNMQLAMKGI